ncbi:hypothetical protein BGZ83_008185 [Gryganskiella cystojenkinii]|nr:hypothetical protein BGZ83_008185 [Gryganskiella cystojenkinii]
MYINNTHFFCFQFIRLMKYFSAAAIFAVAIAFLIPSVTATNAVKFQSLMRSKGCNNGEFFGACQSFAPLGQGGCQIWEFADDLKANQEQCVYQQPPMDLTLCFVFDQNILKADANYFIEKILWYDLFGIYGPFGVGIATWTWAEGEIWDENGIWGTHYGVSIALGWHSSLATSLPLGVLSYPPNMTMSTPHKPSMQFSLIAFFVAFAVALSAPLVTATNPINFKNIARASGCNNGVFYGICKPNAYAHGVCSIWGFPDDLQPYQEYCIFQEEALYLTACFIFDEPVFSADFNFFLEQILWADIFGIYRPSGGVATKAWVEGTVWADTTYGAHFGLKVATGEHSTLNTTLFTNAGAMTWLDDKSMKTPVHSAC